MTRTNSNKRENEDANDEAPQWPALCAHDILSDPSRLVVKDEEAQFNDLGFSASGTGSPLILLVMSDYDRSANRVKEHRGLTWRHKVSEIPEFGNGLSSVHSETHSVAQWFMSEECRALDDSDFYSEHHWMDIDYVEIDEDGPRTTWM